MWLALARQDIGSVVLATPDGLPNEAFREIKRSVLVVSGFKDQSNAGDRHRTQLAIATSCSSMMPATPSAPSGRRRSPNR
jgi:hypothetical protein